jgi:hypothetical protein
MTEQPYQVARDEWQRRLHEATYRLSVALRELHDTNPWPDHPVLEQAVSTLATELWDRCFPLTEIRVAFEAAAADLPRYAADQELRP